jgi:hypothetical protein
MFNPCKHLEIKLICKCLHTESGAVGQEILNGRLINKSHFFRVHTAQFKLLCVFFPFFLSLLVLPFFLCGLNIIAFLSHSLALLKCTWSP